MFNLLPKDTVFFDLFENIATRVVSSAKHLQQLARDFPKIDAAIQMIRNEEHEADDLAHKALDRLDRTFITPFDREDIHALIGELDAHEVPAVPPMAIDGRTLHRFGDFRFSIFARHGGRAPELEQRATLEHLGRFIARMHTVGGARPLDRKSVV